MKNATKSPEAVLIGDGINQCGITSSKN